MRDYEYEVGDVVVIKSWEEMEEEYGLTDAGRSIDCRYVFTSEMRDLCGLQFEITDIDGPKIFGHGTTWSISTDMIKPTSLVSCEYDTSEIDDFLNSMRVV